MAMAMQIPVAHRIGGRKAGRVRAIIAKFPVANQLFDVLKETSRLKDTTHFINKQSPAEIRVRN